MSAQQVADHFSVSIGAVYYALRHLGIERRSAADTNRIHFENKPLSYSIQCERTPEEERLRLAAIMLYWGEGYKVGGNTVDFANSDPYMALIFRRFLSDICHVDEKRIRCSLYCYEGQDIAQLTRFWSDWLCVPESQFYKPYIKASDPGSRGPRMIHGLVHVRYCDTKLLRQILIWIDEYRVECVGGRVVNCDWL